MKTSESLKERLAEAKGKLLEEGASSYLEAIVALNEFSREVQGRCRDVLRRNLPALREAIKLPLDEGQIDQRSFPETISKKGWAAQHGASLGAYIDLKGQGLTFAVELYWEIEDSNAPTIVASATISLGNKGRFERAWPQFEKSQALKYEEPGQFYIYFSEPVLAGEMSAVQGKLTTVLNRMIRAWQNAGGLKAFSQ